MTARVAGFLLWAVVSPDNHDWSVILETYVTPDHLVDYRGLRDHDRGLLSAYLRQLAAPWPALSPNARKAALINAYNALTISWIVDNYPVESIWRTKKPFSEPRHIVNGKRVSLDAIESELRGLDPRVHAALVCAARSCPPLRREPYEANAVDRQLDDNFREWLAMPGRNRFDAKTGTASISKIFEWYHKDFDRLGGVETVLARYGPPAARRITDIEYQPYYWGLNDTSTLGSRYSDWQFYWDRIAN
jgi:hypothetical protein